MNIRSVTVFADLRYPLEHDAVRRAAEIAAKARRALVEAGIAVQTTRLATQPVVDLLANATPDQAVALVVELEKSATENEAQYISLGPVRGSDPSESVRLIPRLLEVTSGVFCSIEMAHQGSGVSLRRLRDAANAILESSALTPDGFTNLRLAAMANVRPWSPFFPAAYHGGGAPRVALAIESADLAVAAIRAANSLASARSTLIAEIERNAGQIESVVKPALDSSGGSYQGIDFSWASFPQEARSIGAALEALGVEALGQSGSLAAAAFLTDTLDRARFTRTGFCGLMLPVLEDSVLAERAAQGKLTVTELLTYSAVCGTGLDTIPLPGNISEGQIAAILADVAALALRLDKQLTARLLPIPGKKAGDLTSFEFEYFANSRVLAGPGSALAGLLAGDEVLDIGPRTPS